MNPMHFGLACVLAGASLGCASTTTENSATGADPEGVTPFGVVLNAVERGARIYCPILLLPFEHPDSLGHEFPNPPRWHASEADTLVVLGERAGLGLGATVRRYPRPVGDDWPYPEFLPPSPERIAAAEVLSFARERAPIPGLRAVAFEDRTLIAFLIDTRGMTLEERGMTRATSMGLDLTRGELLAGMEEVAGWVPTTGCQVVVFGEG